MSHITTGYTERLHDPGSVAVHVGVKRDVLDARIAADLPILPEFWAWAWDGTVHDSWTHWGEASEPDEPAHIIILTLHADELVDVLFDLSDMFAEHPDGGHAILSDPADWSQDQRTIVFDENYQRLEADEVYY